MWHGDDQEPELKFHSFSDKELKREKEYWVYGGMAVGFIISLTVAGLIHMLIG